MYYMLILTIMLCALSLFTEILPNLYYHKIHFISNYFVFFSFPLYIKSIMIFMEILSYVSFSFKIKNCNAFTLFFLLFMVY